MVTLLLGPRALMLARSNAQSAKMAMSCNWSEKMCFVFVSRGILSLLMGERDTKAAGKVQLENVPL